MQTDYTTKGKKIAAGSILAIVVITLIFAIVNYEINANKSTPGSASNTSQTQVASPALNSSNSAASSSTVSHYKDGTYLATSSYYVPNGQESIKVSLTLKSGTITASSIENSKRNPESARYQDNFATEYQSNVNGKDVDSVKLSYVAGASDTTQGFNDALQQIITQARV